MRLQVSSDSYQCSNLKCKINNNKVCLRKTLATLGMQCVMYCLLLF